MLNQILIGKTRNFDLEIKTFDVNFCEEISGGRRDSDRQF